MSDVVRLFRERLGISVETDFDKYIGRLYWGDTQIDSNNFDAMATQLRVRPAGLIMSMLVPDTFTVARKWGIYMALRELIQNAADADNNGMPAPLGYRPKLLLNSPIPFVESWPYDDVLGIADRGGGLPPEALLYGFTDKPFNPLIFRGRFGEGLKGAFATYVNQDRYLIAVHTRYGGLAYAVFPLLIKHGATKMLVYIVGESDLDFHKYSTVAVHTIAPFTGLGRGEARDIIASNLNVVAGMVFSTYLELLRYSNIKYEVIRATEIMGRERYVKHLHSIVGLYERNISQNDVERAVDGGYADTYIVAYEDDNMVGRRVYLRDMLVTSKIEQASEIMEYCIPRSGKMKSEYGYCHEFTYNLPYARVTPDRLSIEPGFLRRYASAVVYSPKLLYYVFKHSTNIRRERNVVFVTSEAEDIVERAPVPVLEPPMDLVVRNIVEAMRMLNYIRAGEPGDVIKLFRYASLTDVVYRVPHDTVFVTLTPGVLEEYKFKSLVDVDVVSKDYKSSQVVTLPYAVRVAEFLKQLMRTMAEVDDIQFTFRSGLANEHGVTSIGAGGIEVSLNIDLLNDVVDYVSRYGSLYWYARNPLTKLVIVLLHELAHVMVLLRGERQIDPHGHAFLDEFHELLYKYSQYVENIGIGILLALYGIVPQGKVYFDHLFDAGDIANKLDVAFEMLPYTTRAIVRENYQSIVRRILSNKMPIFCLDLRRPNSPIEIPYKGYNHFSQYISELSNTCDLIVFPWYKYYEQIDKSDMALCIYYKGKTECTLSIRPESIME